MDEPLARPHQLRRKRHRPAVRPDRRPGRRDPRQHRRHREGRHALAVPRRPRTRHRRRRSGQGPGRRPAEEIRPSNRARSLFAASRRPPRSEAAQAEWPSGPRPKWSAPGCASPTSPGGTSDVRRPALPSQARRSAGVVATRKINPAMAQAPDAPEPLFVVTDMSRLSVLVDALTRPAHRHCRQVRRVEVSAIPSAASTGRSSAWPDPRPQTRRIWARVVVDKPEGLVKPEMYAKRRERACDHPADAGEELPTSPSAPCWSKGSKTTSSSSATPACSKKREVTPRRADPQLRLRVERREGRRQRSSASGPCCSTPTGQRFRRGAAMFDTLITLALRQRPFIIIIARCCSATACTPSTRSPSKPSRTCRTQVQVVTQAIGIAPEEVRAHLTSLPIERRR